MRRVTSTTYPSGSYAGTTDKKFFVYDAATVNGVTMLNAKGRLAEAYTCPPTGSCSPKKTDVGLSYSARGEVVDEYQAAGDVGIYFDSAATYWANGEVGTLGLYGAGGASMIPLQTYGVDGEGRWSSVSAASGQNPVNSTVYDLVNHRTTVTYGSLDSDVFNFDANTFRTNQYNYNVASQTVTGNLTWNANGSLNALAITDPLNSLNAQTCNYTHDDLGRVQAANCGTKWNQAFSFDPFGNIDKTATVGTSFTPTYNLATNRIQALSGCTVTYDANGLPLQDCGRGLQDSYSWDANGKPVNVDGNTIVYDALGRGAEIAAGVYHEPIVYTPTGEKLGQVVNSSGTTYLYRGYVPLPGGGKAVYASAGLSFYLHPDWLGSGRLETTPSRTVYQDVAYAPYGENYSQSGATYDLSFTGQTQDEISVMYDFLFRDYSAITGRWYSPDPAGMAAADPRNPQSWNRYAYVGNNPLSFVDPLGLACPECGDPPACPVGTAFDGTQCQQLPIVSAALPGVFPPGLLNWLKNRPSTFFPGYVVKNPANNCQAPFLCKTQPTATISAVQPPTEAQIKAACSIVAINSNNGFGNAPGDSSSASNANGVVFQQYTQYPRPTTMNPSAPNISALGPLAAPGLFVRASYKNCLSKLGVQ